VVTALYRRYRPETFAEMIGQSQVTEPLMTALRTDRVNHAYLFSGPRGCGKTTSARILARCLNCAQGPTDTPCGTCPSCVELSRGGGGSLDVVEIDAASHNGVDDARDLRERAVFAPARDRYKIFILDEAHMVTPQGFNALLKLVEEPPEHVKFIFATTEPDKVLGTIRSRTHHYPFRLVPPAPMLEYVQQLCDEEHIEVAPGVLALVVRAGGGSPRDTLSLLDQLIAGSEGSTIDYERAVALLGYTHGALLDEIVDAIGAADAAAAFAAADRVVQTGQDPRRFVEDLLERLRDLIVVAASSPEAAATVLRGVPEDELARMAAQAAAFGQAELSRVADLVNQTLTEMTGATSPRLHLELMLARVLVPSTDATERGALARVERLERRVGVDGPVAVDAGARPHVSGAGGSPAGGASVGAAGSGRMTADASGAATASAGAERGGRPSAPEAVRHATPVAGGEQGAAGVSGGALGESVTAGSATRASAGGVNAAGVNAAGASAGGADRTDPGAAERSTAASPTQTSPVVGSPARAGAAPVGPVTLQQVRDAWPEVLAALQRTKRSAWMVAFTAQVRDYRDDDVLVLAFPSEQDVAGFRGGAPGQSVSELLRNSIAEVLGVRVKFIARAEGPGGRGGGVEPTRGDQGGGGGLTAQPAPGGSGTAPGGSGTAPGASGTVPGAGSAGTGSDAGGRDSLAGVAGSRGAEGSRGAHEGGGPTPSSSRGVERAPRVSGASSGPVDSWATVAIPADPDAVGATSVSSGAGEGPRGARLEASVRTATAIAEPRPADPFDDLPSDADAPPEDLEPPFDPGPEPDVEFAPVAAQAPASAGPAPARAATAAASTADASTGATLAAEASVATPAPRSATRREPVANAPRPMPQRAAGDGIQRYGEAVVREILGATFLEEIEAPGFGERG